MMRIALLWLIAAAGFGASFETGTAVSSDGGAHITNAYPVIVRIAGGGLGETWPAPVEALDIPGKLDDPSLMWDGQRVSNFSTTVPVKSTLIESSQMFVASTAAGLEWTAPREIELPFAYPVGKRHMVVRLAGGSYVMPMPNGELYMLLPTGSNFLYESRSADNGATWSEPRRSPLVSHNTPAALWRLEDHPAEIIDMWNRSSLNRYPLSVAISADGGRTWSPPRDVATSDGPQVYYPNMMQDSDGVIVAVWQARHKKAAAISDGSGSLGPGCWTNDTAS